MNNITITGTLGRDMEQRAMPNGDPVGNFSVADSQGRDKPTIWWNVHCRIGSSEKPAQPRPSTHAVHCRIGSSETQKTPQ